MKTEKRYFIVLYILSLIVIAAIFYVLLNFQSITTFFKPLPNAHQTYVEQYGWHLKRLQNEQTFIVDKNPNIDNLIINGLDLTPYILKPVTTTTYLLKETEEIDDKNSRLYITIYEFQGKIIGAIGRNEQREPGNFNIFEINFD